MDIGDEVANMTCFTGGITVHHNSQMCKVTNRKILDMLPDRPPEVTFDCNKADGTCDFQFWIGKQESFYCALDTCKSSIKYGHDANSTFYDCENIKCSCITGRMLCGEDGSVDISDFLTESIRGPATFSCKTGAGCKFREPEMNNLINDIFGDPYITLECGSGECLHYTQVPGYQKPTRPDNRKMVAFSAAAAGLIFVIASAALWYIGRTQPMKEGLGQIRLPEDEAARLMAEHIPASLYFSDISYSIRNRPILEGITGSVKPGQILAIMGASGAGKSTFLDILARKQKRGLVSGTMLVNGKTVDDAVFSKVMGFVDQEDTLMSTLTVYETVLYSALLRLPREMSFEAKKFRTLETMQELGILGIKDSRIGDSGRRSISGGEKRRVSIACELVTSPSILFLDEPTSGLDAFNAYNVVESLVTLARDYNRTVIFTIHQPRSNIVSLFDQLVLLATGKMVYSGELSRCQGYFESIGHPCPPGFNIADYLIDLTMQASGIPENTQSAPTPRIETPPIETPVGDEEQALIRPLSSASHSARRNQSRSLRSSNGQGDTTPQDEETELQTREHSLLETAAGSIKKKTSQLLEVISSSSSRVHQPLSAQLASLVQSYADSDIAKSIRAEIEATSRLESTSPSDLGIAGKSLQTRRRASYGTQFRILSGRAFKNLYRNPALLAAHYISSVAIALMCGLLFRNVTNDIPGFQNRLGMFFFTLSLFGFSCLSSLGLFANERILFMRERSNGYYSAFTYFASKVMFDIVPLRVVPPLVFGGIVYGLVGLVPTVAAFWKFLLTLVLFNLTTASVVLFISVAVANTAVGSLVGTLVMLFNLLFAGLLINRDSVPPAISWLHTISFYHAAFEGLAVNELRYLQLKETKYGVELDVPAATILSMFGLRAQAFWFPDMTLLAVLFSSFLVLSFLYLHFYVKEKR
jgi:ABC-type multidrug transport system ATPase subunit